MSTTLNYYYRYHILLLLTPRERALHGKLSSRNLEDFCWLLNLNAHHKIVKCLINVLLVVFVQNKTILIYGHIIMQFIQLQNVSKETRGITKSLYLFVDGDLIVYLDIL